MNTTILQPNANNAIEGTTALQASGMDWTVEKRPVFTAEGWKVDGQFAVVRSDTTGPEAVLGIVGRKYQCVQNADVLKPLDAVIAADPTREARYDNILCLGNGERIAASVQLSRPFEVVPGDIHENYLTAIFSHDGSSGIKMMLLSFRIACFNATNRAIREAKGNGTLASIPHTLSAASRLNVAARAIAGAEMSIAEHQENMRELASRRMTKTTSEQILDRLFPMGDEEETSAASRTQVENKRTKVLELFESNDDNAIASIRGTAYNFYNAVTEYVDHHQRVVRTNSKTGMSDMQIRQQRALFGTGADVKEKALNEILGITKFVPRRDPNPVSVAFSGQFAQPLQLGPSSAAMVM